MAGQSYRWVLSLTSIEDAKRHGEYMLWIEYPCPLLHLYVVMCEGGTFGR